MSREEFDLVIVASANESAALHDQAPLTPDEVESLWTQYIAGNGSLFDQPPVDAPQAADGDDEPQKWTGGLPEPGEAYGGPENIGQEAHAADGVALMGSLHPAGETEAPGDISENALEHGELTEHEDGSVSVDFEAQRVEDLLPQMPPIEDLRHDQHPGMAAQLASDPHWDGIKHWVRQWTRRELWMAERGFSLKSREKNNP